MHVTRLYIYVYHIQYIQYVETIDHSIQYIQCNGYAHRDTLLLMNNSSNVEPVGRGHQDP